MNRIELPTKDPASGPILLPQNGWDFSAYLALGETISSVLVTVTVYSGQDPFPNTIVQGTSIVSPVVFVFFVAGVSGTIYAVTVAARTSNENVIALSGYLAVSPQLP